MAKLFGLNIAGIVNSSIAAAGGVHPGVLTRTTAGTRDPANLAGGTNPTSASYSFKGFAEVEGDRREGTTVATSGGTVTILGASVKPIGAAAAIDGPEVNDVVVLEGVTYTLSELVERDPASAAYVFSAEES